MSSNSNSSSKLPLGGVGKDRFYEATVVDLRSGRFELNSLDLKEHFYVITLLCIPRDINTSSKTNTKPVQFSKPTSS